MGVEESVEESVEDDEARRRRGEERRQQQEEARREAERKRKEDAAWTAHRSEDGTVSSSDCSAYSPKLSTPFFNNCT